MIYRGYELRCIAEVRAESDNHGGWLYRGRGFAKKTKTKLSATDKNRRVVFSESIFLAPRETVRHPITPPILSDG